MLESSLGGSDVVSDGVGRREAGRDVTALDRVQLLLAASETLAEATSVAGVRAGLNELVFTALLKPARVAVVISQDRGVQGTIEDQRQPGDEDDPARPAVVAGQWVDFDSEAPTVTAKTVRERRLLHYPTPASIDADLPPAARSHYEQAGLRAVVCAPLVSGSEVLGVLELGWEEPHEADPWERAVITALASYTASALDRVRFLQHRISVAHQLQAALLTELPQIPDLSLASCYRPAGAHEQVGGDWYDVISTTHPGVVERRRVVLSVGDITSHDLHAATLMGQVRSMLRQASWDHPDYPPSQVFAAMEAAEVGLGLGATGTALLAHLHPLDDGTGRWALTWTNAGHPPPVLIHPDGSTETLDAHDMLFGLSEPSSLPTRRDAHRLLSAGTTLLCYTDGLIEHRGYDLDQSITAVRELASTLRHRRLQELVDTLVTTLAGPAPDDDSLALAVRLPAL